MANKNNKIIGNVLKEHLEIASTHLFASELLSAKSKPQNGTVITAAYQHQGRGQIGSSWFSSADKNILCSAIVIHDDLKVDKMYFQNCAICLAVRDTLQPYLTTPILIKWPNDIYIDNKKLGGILVQNQLSGMKCSASIWSMGLNINEQDFPSYLPNPISIAQHRGQEVDLKIVFNNLLENLNLYYQLLLEKEYGTLRHQFHEYLLGLGEYRTFLINKQQRQGLIKEVTEDGRLALEWNGEIQYFNNKEIEYCW